MLKRVVIIGNTDVDILKRIGDCIALERTRFSFCREIPRFSCYEIRTDIAYILRGEVGECTKHSSGPIHIGLGVNTPAPIVLYRPAIQTLLQLRPGTYLARSCSRMNTLFSTEPLHSQAPM